MYLFVLECHHPTQSVNRVRENIHAAAQGPTLMLVLCLPVCLSICWSICLWIHLPICPSARTSLAHTFTPASSSATRLILVPPFCFCEAHSPAAQSRVLPDQLNGSRLRSLPLPAACCPGLRHPGTLPRSELPPASCRHPAAATLFLQRYHPGGWLLTPIIPSMPPLPTYRLSATAEAATGEEACPLPELLPMDSHSYGKMNLYLIILLLTS